MDNVILPCGKLISLFLFCLHFLLSILFFNLTYVHKTFSRTELACPVMGTIFLFLSLQVQGIAEVIEEMGNPFVEETEDLLRLDTRDIVDPAVATSICYAEEKGIEQFKNFVTSEPIKKNSYSVDLLHRIQYKSTNIVLEE